MQASQDDLVAFWKGEYKRWKRIAITIFFVLVIIFGTIYQLQENIVEKAYSDKDKVQSELRVCTLENEDLHSQLKTKEDLIWQYQQYYAP